MPNTKKEKAKQRRTAQLAAAKSINQTNVAERPDTETKEEPKPVAVAPGIAVYHKKSLEQLLNRSSTSSVPPPPPPPRTKPPFEATELSLISLHHQIQTIQREMKKEKSSTDEFAKTLEKIGALFKEDINANGKRLDIFAEKFNQKYSGLEKELQEAIKALKTEMKPLEEIKPLQTKIERMLSADKSKKEKDSASKLQAKDITSLQQQVLDLTSHNKKLIQDVGNLREEIINIKQQLQTNQAEFKQQTTDMAGLKAQVKPLAEAHSTTQSLLQEFKTFMSKTQPMTDQIPSLQELERSVTFLREETVKTEEKNRAETEAAIAQLRQEMMVQYYYQQPLLQPSVTNSAIEGGGYPNQSNYYYCYDIHGMLCRFTLPPVNGAAYSAAAHARLFPQNNPRGRKPWRQQNGRQSKDTTAAAQTDSGILQHGAFAGKVQSSHPTSAPNSTPKP